MDYRTVKPHESIISWKNAFSQVNHSEFEKRLKVFTTSSGVYKISFLNLGQTDGKFLNPSHAAIMRVVAVC